VLQKVAQEVAGIRLEDANVVIAGGRGIGGAKVSNNWMNWQKY